MSSDHINKDWMIALTLRPAQMLAVDPPVADNNNDRLLSSILCLTLGDSLSCPTIEPYLLEHIELERECSQQADLCLAWSDDVALTLCFIASLAHDGGYSHKHLSQQYSNWWMHGYMSPNGLCFTPRVHIKQTIEQMSIIIAAQTVGVAPEDASMTAPPSPPAAALLRISPLAYFYADCSPSARLEVIKNCVREMLGPKISVKIFVAYIELLVNALKGQFKETILASILALDNQDDSMAVAFSKLIDVLRNDNNDIEKGVQQALAFNQETPQECRLLNPYDSTKTIIATLYLQVAGALYAKLPQVWLEHIYAKETLTSLARWIDYERHRKEID